MNKKILSATTALAVVLNMAAPAFAATSLVITGNGAESVNDVAVQNTHTTNVVQSNDTQIENKIEVKADTGGNDANANTGGNVAIDTGDVLSAVKVKNDVNSNVAQVDGCCGSDVDAKIQGNGAESVNNVALSQNNNIVVAQLNEADIENDIEVEAETGRNDANANTGGSVQIMTGSALVDVKAKTAGNSNAAVVGGSTGSALSAYIVENGAESLNSMALAFDHNLDVIQNNTADVENEVEVEAETGRNDANANTGGDVVIDTGDAAVGVLLDNELGFNVGDFGCGCFIEDIMAKIHGNGAESESTIAALFETESSHFQTNETDLENEAELDPKTGKNDANANTGESDSDPSIVTGDSVSKVVVKNSGSVNTIGSFQNEADPIYEYDGEHFGLRITFDLSSLFRNLLGI